VPRNAVDWPACEKEFRTGTLSNRQIAEMYNCTEGAIRERAKRYGWQRDLSAEVRKATNAKLLRADLRAASRETDPQTIADSSDLRVSVVLRHRKDIAKLDSLKMKLVEKAETLLGHVEDLGTLVDAAQALESLGRTTHRLIPLERQAFNLDDKGVDDISNLSRDEAEAELARLRSAQGAGATPSYQPAELPREPGGVLH
jgi:hypothetical protein